jgi:DNA-binding transcriptional LysR family regulator
MKLNRKNLESFRAIIQTGSVTDAAKQLGLTQSAVSRQLAQLEEDVGLKLFHRRNSRVIPVPEAVELCKEVELALSSLDRIKLLADDLKNHVIGHLRVVGPPSFVEGVLAGAIASFLVKHPNIQFTVDSRNHEEIIEQTDRRIADCGFLKLPVTHNNLMVEPMVKARTACVMKKGHALEQNVSITAKDLSGVPLILLGKGRSFQEKLREAFHSAKVRPLVRAETHAIGASCALAAQGVGVAIVNEMVAKTYEGLGLSLVPFTPNISHEYAFVSSSQFPMSKLACAFRDHCAEYFDQKKPE